MSVTEAQEISCSVWNGPPSLRSVELVSTRQRGGGKHFAEPGAATELDALATSAPLVMLPARARRSPYGPVPAGSRRSRRCDTPRARRGTAPWRGHGFARDGGPAES